MIKEKNVAPLIDLFLFTRAACLCVNDRLDETVEDEGMESDERLRCAVRQTVSLAVSRGLPLHTPLHPPLPISLVSVIHRALRVAPSLFAVHLPSLSLTLFLFAPRLSA